MGRHRAGSPPSGPAPDPVGRPAPPITDPVLLDAVRAAVLGSARAAAAPPVPASVPPGPPVATPVTARSALGAVGDARVEVLPRERMEPAGRGSAPPRAGRIGGWSVGLLAGGAVAALLFLVALMPA